MYTVQNISDLADHELLALIDEPEFLTLCTPLELELIVRFGSLFEASALIENELSAEVARLASYEPEQVKVDRMKLLNEEFVASVYGLTRRSNVRVAGI